MALFFRLVRKMGIRYHFVIDVHTIENIPYMRLVEIQTYLGTQRERLRTHLHNSTIVTQSEAMKKVVNLSMTTIYTPTRPFLCVVARPPQEMHPLLKVPACVADEVSTFMLRNVNTTPLPPSRTPHENGCATAKNIDVSTLPRLT
jgi:hypothetical protein